MERMKMKTEISGVFQGKNEVSPASENKKMIPQMTRAVCRVIALNGPAGPAIFHSRVGIRYISTQVLKLN
jgi:hypothetical protein